MTVSRKHAMCALSNTDRGGGGGGRGHGPPLRTCNAMLTRKRQGQRLRGRRISAQDGIRILADLGFQK